MMYPHGSVDLNRLKRIVESNKYNVWFEDSTQEPKDWNWQKDGFWRGELTPIKNIKDLPKFIEKELDGEGSICYDMTEEYYESHPYVGESAFRTTPSLRWEWQSYETKRRYSICECSYLGRKPNNPSFELNCFENGFEGNCFSIATWEWTSEGYEFHSVGSRLFDNVDELDLTEIWQAVKKTDAWLKALEVGE